MNNTKLINILIQDSIIQNTKHYGLEGMLEAIHRVYANMPVLKEKMLDQYYKLYKLERNEL